MARSASRRLAHAPLVVCRETIITPNWCLKPPLTCRRLGTPARASASISHKMAPSHARRLPAQALTKVAWSCSLLDAGPIRARPSAAPYGPHKTRRRVVPPGGGGGEVNPPAAPSGPNWPPSHLQQQHGPAVLQVLVATDESRSDRRAVALMAQRLVGPMHASRPVVRPDCLRTWHKLAPSLARPIWHAGGEGGHGGVETARRVAAGLGIEDATPGLGPMPTHALAAGLLAALPTNRHKSSPHGLARGGKLTIGSPDALGGGFS